MVYDYKSDITGIGNRSLTSLDDTSALYLSVCICSPILGDYMSDIFRFVNISLTTLDRFLYSIVLYFFLISEWQRLWPSPIFYFALPNFDC